MKRINVMLFAFLLLLCLTNCSCNSTSENSTSIKESENENMIDTYSKIYSIKNEKEEILTGNCRYFASSGYIKNKKQGFNNFYYQFKKNNMFFNMEYSNEKWSYENCFIDQDIMNSTQTILSTRMFISPISGETNIKCPVFVKRGLQTIIKIYNNEDLLLAKEILFDSEYFEIKDVLLEKNDELRFVLESNSTISFNPEIDFNNKELSLHQACDGFYGDVHPFYDEKSNKMYMYYLSTGNQTNENKVMQFQSLLSTSNDMIHYEPDSLKMDEKARPEQDLYYVLNVFKDKAGNYRTSVGANMHASSAMSNDLHTWKNGNEPYLDDNGDIKYAFCTYFDKGVYGGRDPDTFYDCESDKYYTIVINYYSNKGSSGDKGLALYVGNNKGDFSTKSTKLLSFTNKGDPECPQIKKIGNRFYIFYSEYGTGTSGNVGKIAYRIGDENSLPQDVKWEEKKEYYLDGGDLHAAQVVKVLDKYYLYGWINKTPNKNVWGGYLNLPREVYQDNQGELKTRFDYKLLEVLNKGLVYKKIGIDTTELPSINRNIVKMNLNSNNTFFTYDNYKIGIINNELYVESNDKTYKVSLEIKKKEKNELTIIFDSDFIEMNLNNEYSLTSFIKVTGDSRIQFSTQNNSFENIQIYKLSDYKNIML